MRRRGVGGTGRARGTGGSRWRRPDLQRGSEDRCGVVFHERTLSRLPAAPGFSRLTGRPQHPTQDSGRTRAKTRASWRLSKKRPPKPCLPFEPRSGRQADRGPGSGRGPHQDEVRIGQKTGRVRIRARKLNRDETATDRDGRPISVTNRPPCPARCAQTGRPARP